MAYDGPTTGHNVPKEESVPQQIEKQLIVRLEFLAQRLTENEASLDAMKMDRNAMMEERGILERTLVALQGPPVAPAAPMTVGVGAIGRQYAGMQSSDG